MVIIPKYNGEEGDMRVVIIDQGRDGLTPEQATKRANSVISLRNKFEAVRFRDSSDSFEVEVWEGCERVLELDAKDLLVFPDSYNEGLVSQARKENPLPRVVVFTEDPPNGNPFRLSYKWLSLELAEDIAFL